MTETIQCSCMFIFVILLFTFPYATMSHSECTANPPKLDPESGAGHVDKLGGLNCYISGSSHSKKAIVLASDVYGYTTPLLRKIADKVAAAGYYAVVPDFVHGDPFDRNNAARPVPVWLKVHQTDKAYKDAKPLIKDLKSKGITSIGAAGFCWGGKLVVRLSRSRLIEAAVLLHPSYSTVDDIAGVNIPTAILGAETDSLAPPSLLKQFEQALNGEPAVPNFVKVFPKTSHGWTIRYNETDAEAVKHADEAHQDMLNWFSKYVK